MKEERRGFNQHQKGRNQDSMRDGEKRVSNQLMLMDIHDELLLLPLSSMWMH